jgi:hypothetical protein
MPASAVEAGWNSMWRGPKPLSSWRLVCGFKADSGRGRPAFTRRAGRRAGGQAGRRAGGRAGGRALGRSQSAFKFTASARVAARAAVVLWRAACRHTRQSTALHRSRGTHSTGTGVATAQSDRTGRGCAREWCCLRARRRGACTPTDTVLGCNHPTAS